MYVRPIYRDKDGKRHAYWALMESVRTARGPRSRVVAYLGTLPEAERRAIEDTAAGGGTVQGDLFGPACSWAEVDTSRVRVERMRQFGGPWLGRKLMEKAGLDAFLSETLEGGREEVPWAIMAQVLILCRLCEPSSELYIAEHFYRQSALADLLGVAPDKVNDDRLYRALDKLLPHKEALEKHLRAAGYVVQFGVRLAVVRCDVDVLRGGK
jgi:hypothetical protein